MVNDFFGGDVSMVEAAGSKAGVLISSLAVAVVVSERVSVVTLTLSLVSTVWSKVQPLSWNLQLPKIITFLQITIL